MTHDEPQVTHFYGDGCEPAHTESPETAEKLTASYAMLAKEYRAMPGTPDQTGGAPPERGSALQGEQMIDTRAILEHADDCSKHRYDLLKEVCDAYDELAGTVAAMDHAADCRHRSPRGCNCARALLSKVSEP